MPGRDSLTVDDLKEMYTDMLTIREFEETAVAESKQGTVYGNMHMYVGEEAIAVGVCRAIDRGDYISSTHRCDGHLIARGADTGAMMAELMGRRDGICGGRAGKMHQCAPEIGVMCANGIVGASQSLATGHALYCKLYEPDKIAVAFFGDGGGNQGAFHESMNLAAVWKLPVVFICENNHYAISTNVRESTAMGTFYQRAAGYGIPGILVNGNDALAVYEAAKAAAERARRGEGPSLIECDTCRYRGHHEGDDQKYRPKEEVLKTREENDCILRMQKLLMEQFGMTQQEDLQIRETVRRRIEAAVAFGKASEPMAVETMENGIFAD